MEDIEEIVTKPLTSVEDIAMTPSAAGKKGNALWMKDYFTITWTLQQFQKGQVRTAFLNGKIVDEAGVPSGC